MGSWFLETQRVKVTEIIQVKSTSMKIELTQKIGERKVCLHNPKQLFLCHESVLSC